MQFLHVPTQAKRMAECLGGERERERERKRKRQWRMRGILAGDNRKKDAVEKMKVTLERTLKRAIKVQ